MDMDVALPKRRLNFSVAMKQQAINWIVGPGRGCPRVAAAHFRSLNWEVSAETMDKWWKNRDKILGTPGGADVEPRWALLSAIHEIALANAIRRRARKVRVSAKWIVLAVRQMYPEKHNRSFSVSKTWLLGFTQRHGLKLLGTTVVSASSSSSSSAGDSSRRRAAASAGSSSSSSSSQKSQGVRSMSLHDVLYESKSVVTSIAA